MFENWSWEPTHAHPYEIIICSIMKLDVPWSRNEYPNVCFHPTTLNSADSDRFGKTGQLRQYSAFFLFVFAPYLLQCYSTLGISECYFHSRSNILRVDKRLIANDCMNRTISNCKKMFHLKWCIFSVINKAHSPLRFLDTSNNKKIAKHSRSTNECHRNNINWMKKKWWIWSI